MNTTRAIVVAVALLVCLALALGRPIEVAPTAHAQNTDCYQMQGGNKWVCDNGGEFELQSGAVLDVQSGVDVTFAAPIKLAAGEHITVTAGTAFTPTSSYQPIAAAAHSTPTLAVLPEGTVVTLINTGSATVVLADSGTLKASSDVSLGQYDAATFLSDGTNWIQVAESDN